MNPVIASKMSEEEFLAMVIDRARARGWKVYHPRPARTSTGWVTAGQGDAVGYPDITLARDGVVVLAELKAARGQLTDSQREWLAACGGQVWRPSMWSEICDRLDAAREDR